LREKLLNRDTEFTKEYLKLLVREVELKETQAIVCGGLLAGGGYQSCLPNKKSDNRRSSYRIQ